MKITLFGKLFKLLSSPRLTVALLVYGTLLVFIGTLAQRNVGIMEAQRTYFESFFCLADIGGLKIPMFGGAFVGALGFVNIMFSGVRFTRFGLSGFGVAVTHMALALLIVSGALQYFVRVEGSMALREGVPVDTIMVGGRDGAPMTVKKLPFSVNLKSFKEEKWEGSDIPKSYSSEVFFEHSGGRVPAVIKMNNPASFGGWTFYQMSFGEGGKVSVLSAVKNHARMLPWISVGGVFIGMLIIFIPRVAGKSGRL